MAGARVSRMLACASVNSSTRPHMHSANFLLCRVSTNEIRGCAVAGPRLFGTFNYQDQLYAKRCVLNTRTMERTRLHGFAAYCTPLPADSYSLAFWSVRTYFCGSHHTVPHFFGKRITFQCAVVYPTKFCRGRGPCPYSDHSQI